MRRGVRLLISEVTEVDAHRRVQRDGLEQIAVIAERVLLEEVVEIRHADLLHRERLGPVGQDENLAERKGHALPQRIGQHCRRRVGPQLRRAHRARPPSVLLRVAVEAERVAIRDLPLRPRLKSGDGPRELIVNPPAETERHHRLHILRNLPAGQRLIRPERRLQKKARRRFHRRQTRRRFIFQIHRPARHGAERVARAALQRDDDRLGRFRVVAVSDRIQQYGHFADAGGDEDAVAGDVRRVVRAARGGAGERDVHRDRLQAGAAPHHDHAGFRPALADPRIKHAERHHARRAQPRRHAREVGEIVALGVIRRGIESEPPLLRIRQPVAVGIHVVNRQPPEFLTRRHVEQIRRVARARCDLRPLRSP